MACRRWRNLVAGPSFLRSRWPDQGYYSCLVSFIAWEHYHGEAFPKLCFVPTPRSPLGHGLRSLGSFLTNAPAGLFDGAVPLVSRHGLLLLRVLPHDAHGHPDDPDQSILQLAVCSLLVGTFQMLPPLKLASPMDDDYELAAYAVLNGADCHSSDDDKSRDPSFFKVAIISLDYDGRDYSLLMFSSDQTSWTARTNCFGNTSYMEDIGLFGEAVVCRGTVHWVFCYSGDPYFYAISLNTQTGSISRMKLHFLRDLTSYISLTLGANGTLSVLWMQKTGTQLETQLEIWGQQEEQQNVGGACSEWVCTRTIEEKELREEAQGRELCVMAEKCGTLLFNDSQHLYTADLETGRVAEVSNWPCESSISPPWNVMPLEMDWPTIFISRLSATF